jgi:uncharacterized protein YfiM (DUF2279 family)
VNACLVVFGLLLGCSADPRAAPAAPPSSSDAWFAEDKLRHFAMSFAATGFAYGGARFALEPRPARVTAGAAALAAGIGKEVHDARQGRPVSLRDMAWNIAGVALGIALTHNTR